MHHGGTGFYIVISFLESIFSLVYKSICGKKATCPFLHVRAEQHIVPGLGLHLYAVIRGQGK